MRGWCSFPWYKDHFFIKTSDVKFKQINVAAGSIVSEWPIYDASFLCIAMLQHGKFIACSDDTNVII